MSKEMNFILIMSFLLLGTETGWSHSLARIEESQTEVNSTVSQDIYQIKDDTSSLQFVYPKQKQPTLREIIYYHVIERPFESKSEPNQEAKDSLEMINEDLADEDFIKVPDSNELSTDGEYEIIYIDEAEDNDNAEMMEIPADVVTKDYEKEKKNDNIQSQPEPAIRARNLLFDQVKEKYYKKYYEQKNTSAVPLSRRKREVFTEEIPEAPELEELDLDSLPPHIRNMVSVGQNYIKTLDQEKDLEDIRQRMHGVFGKMDDVDSDEGPAPKTYGMTLDGDVGYVWNDMFTDPGVSYEIIPPNEKYDQKHIKQKPKETIIDLQKDEEHKEDIDQSEVDKFNENVSEPENDSDDGKEETSDEESSKPNESEDEKKNEMSNSELARKKNKKPKEKEDPIQNLMENEHFWKWLEEWTLVYMEELTKHIKKQIKAEVTKQINTITKSQNNDKEEKNTPDREDKPKEEEPSENNSLDKPTCNSVSEKSSNGDKSNDPKTHSVENIKDISESNLSTSSENSTHKEDSTTKEDDEKTQSKEEMDRHISDNEEKSDRNKTTPFSVKAKNMYGSAIGSDQVTNFFIFYPSKETKEIINELKPSNLSKGTYIIGKPDEENRNSDNEINISKPKEVSTTNESKEITPEIDTRINANLEDITNADKNITLDDATLEITSKDSHVEKDTTTKDGSLSKTDQSKDEKEKSEDDNLKENTESAAEKKPLADKSEESSNPVNREEIQESNEDKKDKIDETPKANEAKDDSKIEKENDSQREESEKED